MHVLKVFGIMKVIEYIGEVLPDGHLSLPDEVQKELGLCPHSSVKVTLTVEDSRVLDEKKGWEAFRRLVRDAAGSGKQHLPGDSWLRLPRACFGRRSWVVLPQLWRPALAHNTEGNPACVGAGNEAFPGGGPLVTTAGQHQPVQDRIQSMIR